MIEFAPLQTGYFVVCACPPDWNSVIPPTCMVHNPPRAFYPTVWTATSTAPYILPIVNTAIRRKRRKRLRRR